jgi:elongation factor Ts
MAKISAADVKKLRDMTGAGMMDCKKALEEADGDFQKAIEILRKKGQKVANKRADRETNEGISLGVVSADGKKAYMVAVGCETDFVARTEDFENAVDRILKAAVENDVADIDALKQTKTSAGQTVEDEITQLSGKTGEKVVLLFYGRVEGEYANVYNHFNKTNAAIAAFNKQIPEEVAKDVLMQIASMKPIAIDVDDVPEDVKQKELEIGKEAAINEGKPAEIAERIAQGRLKKFLEENTLLNQKFIKDNKITVRDYLKKHDPEVTVVDFKRYSVHE